MRLALPGRLLIVTDRHLAGGPLMEVAESALAAGARWLWLRDRDMPPTERRHLARDLADLSRRYSATLSVGADVALAAEVGAGVQLGSGSDVAAARRALGPAAPIGVSAHGLEDLRRARDDGADYATLSPVFPSPTKPGYGPALGPQALRDAATLGLPLLALGGITGENARACLEAGAFGLAVMGSAMRDAVDTVTALLEACASSAHRVPSPEPAPLGTSLRL